MNIMKKVTNMINDCAKKTRFERICRMTQKGVKKFVESELKKTHKEVIVDDGFVYAQGEFPVLLVAHMDTVHKSLPNTIVYEKNRDVISSPNGIGGDDRCGIYMVLEVIKKFNCSVVFCEDEEIGLIGAEKFVENKISIGLDFNTLSSLTVREVEMQYSTTAIIQTSQSLSAKISTRKTTEAVLTFPY